MDSPVKTYQICYKVECEVEAKNEDEAMQKYSIGQIKLQEYAEFLSIELKSEKK